MTVKPQLRRDIHLPDYNALRPFLEQLLIESRKTRMKIISLANHKRMQTALLTNHKQIHIADAKRGKTCVSESRLVFALFLAG
jgi:hypothetical protein